MLLVVVVNHPAAVPHHLGACRLAGRDRFGDDLEIEPGALCDCDAFCHGGDLHGTDHVDDELVGGPRADATEAQDPLGDRAEEWRSRRQVPGVRADQERQRAAGSVLGESRDWGVEVAKIARLSAPMFLLLQIRTSIANA